MLQLQKLGFAAALTLSAAAFSQGAFAQDLIVGGPGDAGNGDCAPFGCVQQYQQVYAASDFSGPEAISALTFFNNNFQSGATVDPANYTISLSTTSKPVNGLSSTFADNLGADNTTFYTGTLSGALDPATHKLTINGNLPFVFNPALGNLLLSVTKDASSGRSGLYLDYDSNSNGLFSRAYSFPASGPETLNNDYGLVTGFTYAPAVPEASTTVSLGLLLALGLGGLTVAKKRKQSA